MDGCRDSEEEEQASDTREGWRKRRLVPALILCSSGALSLVQSRLSRLLPPDLSLLCLSLPAAVSPPPPHPRITSSPFSALAERGKKRFFALPRRSTASETLLWFPQLLSMGLSPQPQITPMSHCLNVSDVFSLFLIAARDGFTPAVSIK